MIEKQIRKYFVVKNSSEEIDDTLIDELVFNIKLINKCKKDIDEEGYKINVTVREGGQDYWVKSQSFIAYQYCLKNINIILTSLGCTPRERAKLKLAIAEPDNFDSIMSM